MSYITTSEANSFCDISDTTLTQTLIDSAESLMNNVIDVDTLSETSRTEYLETDNLCKFIVSYHNPHGTVKVDGVTLTLNTDYYWKGRQLILKTATTQATTFPFKNKIEYQSGFAPIPNDIKTAMYQIVGSLDRSRMSSGITEFRQDALTVKFGSNEGLSKLMGNDGSSIVQAILSNYKLLKFKAPSKKCYHTAMQASV